MPFLFLQRRVRVICFAALSAASLLSGCGSGFRTFPPGTVLSTSPTSVSVYPYTTEDLHGPCVYDLRLPVPDVTVAGSLIVFERGDTQAFYSERTIQAAADALHYAMVFAHECDAQTTGDFQADAAKGPSRTLFTALSALATSSGHAELSTGSVALFGYSAAGVLAATMLDSQPSRIVAAVEYVPGDAHVDLSRVPVSTAAARVPALILANALDQKSGTTRALTYFQTGRAAGAPWAFGVQHATDHCCSLSSRPLVLPWLTAIAAANADTSGIAPTYATFLCTRNQTVDVFGNTNCEISTAGVLPTAPATGVYGWLPDAASASAWMSWVLNPATNQ